MTTLDPTVDGILPEIPAAEPRGNHAANRSRVCETTGLTVELAGLTGDAVGSATTLSDDDVYATNTLDDPQRVVPHTNESLTLADGYATIALPPISWTAITLTPAAGA